MDSMVYRLGESPLDVATFTEICAGSRRAELGAEARRPGGAVPGVPARAGVRRERIYGVNTGFGKLADTVIPTAQLAELQRNLVRSHAVGWGPALPREQARGLVFLRAVSLAGGYSGVRPELIEQLLWLLEADVTPWIPGADRSAPAAIWRRWPTWPWC
jgi:histidine ammonia-lyase